MSQNGLANSTQFYSSSFFVSPTLLCADYISKLMKMGLTLKKLKIIINNNFTTFIFCKIKFL